MTGTIWQLQKPDHQLSTPALVAGGVMANATNKIKSFSNAVTLTANDSVQIYDLWEKKY